MKIYGDTTELNLAEYCQGCPDIKPIVETDTELIPIPVMSLVDNPFSSFIPSQQTEKKTTIKISCDHAGRCSFMALQIRRMLKKEEEKEKC